MKTTIDLPDALYVAAKRHAAKHGITLRALIEQSLTNTLQEKSPPDGFKLRDASVDGKGLTEAARALSSSAWRDMANGSGNPRH